ncbi:ABC transporter permease [Variovorax paradoxus]|uniref:ABC transporter permease n=1 Tax=Variovorax paradoxus TaxID=34073 RepID=UPI0019349082
MSPTTVARRLLVGVTYAAMLLPLVTVAWLSVFAQPIMSFPPEGYSLHWYANAWSKPQFASSFVLSLQLAAISALLGVGTGTAAAYAIERGRFRGRRALSALLLSPLAFPGVVLGTGIYVFFVRVDNAIDLQIVATLPGLIAAHALLAIPWTVRLVSASLQGLGRAPEEAAANLGARPLTVFLRVTLPSMRAGIVAAAVFSFIASFENLEMTMMLTGPGYATLPVEMLSYLNFNMNPTLAAVGTVQTVLIAVLLLVADRFVSLSRVTS